MRKSLLRGVIALATAALLALPTAAVAAQGTPGGQGKKPGGETLGNNLSVPTYFVGGTDGAPTLRTACPSDAMDPTGPTATYNGVDYYLQKTEATWTAECSTPDTATVEALWGSNLTNGRPLKAGRPARVEMALLSADTGTGYVVDNLTPLLPDRQSTYGTLGTPTTMAFMAWTAGAGLTIQPVVNGTPGTAIVDTAFTAEINSTGKVVYGYNWGTSGRAGAPTPGTYLLTFSVPTDSGVTIGSVNPGEAGVVTSTDTTATVQITVSTAGGGGSGR